MYIATATAIAMKALSPGSWPVVSTQLANPSVCMYERKRKIPGVKHQHLFVTLYVSSNRYLLRSLLL